MFTIAYLANQFPAPVEPYVSEEIEELRQRGVHVIAGSARRSDAVMPQLPGSGYDSEILCLQPIRVLTLLRALALIVRDWALISDLLARILLKGRERLGRRVKTLLHTWLGAYYAILLQERGVHHIHAHHGYFGSWIALVAARLLEVSFSLTLHGSDLLLNGAYLDTKLKNCRFCVTISNYNRSYILRQFPDIGPGKIMVSRLGVAVEPYRGSPIGVPPQREPFTIVAVGRLHAVKDHAFLVRACAHLRDFGLDFQCLIAGEGPERKRLELLIHEKRLEGKVLLLGYVPKAEVDAIYERAHVVVLTSRSEGIPLVLMEAMARGRIVLAPAITGIPELVVNGKTGFLYAPGALEDFMANILRIRLRIDSESQDRTSSLAWMQHAGRAQILHNFNRRKNLSLFADQFLRRIEPANTEPHYRSSPHEDPVLQQI